MPRVFIPVQMRSLSAGVESLDVEAVTLRQAIAAVEQRWPALVGRLRVEDGLAPGLAVSIDGAFASRGLLARLESASEVHFLPAIGGG